MEPCAQHLSPRSAKATPPALKLDTVKQCDMFRQDVRPAACDKLSLTTSRNCLPFSIPCLAPKSRQAPSATSNEIRLCCTFEALVK